MLSHEDFAERGRNPQRTAQTQGSKVLPRGRASDHPRKGDARHGKVPGFLREAPLAALAFLRDLGFIFMVIYTKNAAYLLLFFCQSIHIHVQILVILGSLPELDSSVPHSQHHRFFPDFFQCARLIASPLSVRQLLHCRHESISGSDCYFFAARLARDDSKRNEGCRAFFPPRRSHHNSNREICICFVTSLRYCHHVDLAPLVDFEAFTPHVCAMRIPARLCRGRAPEVESRNGHFIDGLFMLFRGLLPRLFCSRSRSRFSKGGRRGRRGGWSRGGRGGERGLEAPRHVQSQGGG